jgi:hypothetical protein
MPFRNDFTRTTQGDFGNFFRNPDPGRPWAADEMFAALVRIRPSKGVGSLRIRPLEKGVLFKAYAIAEP